MQSGPKPPSFTPSNGKPYASDGRKYGKRAKPHDIDFARLTDAMRYSRRRLLAFRQERTNAVREYVGRHYSDGGAEHRVPVNLLARFVQVMARSLVPNTPRMMLTTKVKEMVPAVSAMEEWHNKRIEEMHFAETLRRWVVDSMFCLGIIKVALGTPADAAMSGYVSPAGVPFAEIVDVDDFVFDAGSRDLRRASFAGHVLRMPYDVAMKLDYFDGAAKKWLRGSVVAGNRIATEDGDERISTVGGGYEGSGYSRDFEEMVDLWEVYLPRMKKVVTLCSSSGGVPDPSCPPLRVQEWVGPDCGPFHYLALMPVPGNAMPKAPIHDLIDLHEFVNHGYRKLANQMARQKTVVPVRGAAVDDGKRIIQANDGDMIQCENAEGVKELSYGGPNPVNANFTVHLADTFNKMAGNLDLLSGSNQQSKTATQDRILNENASAGVQDWQEQTVSGIAAVADAMNWFWWYHPQEVMQSSRSLPGAEDISITRRLHPGGQYPPGQKPGLTRDGRYEDLRLKIDPYSLVYRTPQQRLTFLSGLVKDLAPMFPILAQQGVQFDAMAYLKKVAQYADEPDVTTLFTVVEPTMPTQGPGEGGMSDPRMPTQTSREYVRRSVGQDTQANRNAEFDNSMSEMSGDMSE